MRIGVIAPNLALRTGLRALLGSERSLSAISTVEASETQFQVVFEAASVGEFVQMAPPDVDTLVIVAESEEQVQIQQGLPDGQVRLAILLLSDDPGPAQTLAMLPLRGWGVLPLDSSVEELQAALWAIDQGLVVGTSRLYARAFLDPQLVGGQEMGPLNDGLTERENQVLQLLAHGLANKQIALRLGISEHTVKFHISSIYNKLGVTNRTEAVRAGVQRGLVLL
jgi:DNA-binding NarL/FixJ family response regulator